MIKTISEAKINYDYTNYCIEKLSEEADNNELAKLLLSHIETYKQIIDSLIDKK